MLPHLISKTQVSLSMIYPLAFIFLCAFASIASAQTTTTFSNNAGVTITDRASGATNPQPGTPYPSNIIVSGLTNPVTKVRVTLTSFTHQFQDDAGFLLVGPGGQKVRLMTDCGGNGAGAVTLTFDDAGTTLT